MEIGVMLGEGGPRSLGRTEEVVQLVLTDKTMLDQLFKLIHSDDAIIRMRASDALEKICKQNPDWFKPYKKKLLQDWPKVKQPSVQWHLAQILSEISLTPIEIQQAIAILKNNLSTTNDWIVENLSLESLASFTRKGNFDEEEFTKILELHSSSRHKSVKSRVNKLLNEFSKDSL